MSWVCDVVDTCNSCGATYGSRSHGGSTGNTEGEMWGHYSARNGSYVGTCTRSVTKYFSAACSFGAYGDWIIDYYPTCTTDGHRHRYRYCSVCGGCQTQNEVMPKLGHIWSLDNSEITTKPTPYTSGIRTFTCGRDGNHKTNVVEPPLQFAMFNLDARISKIYLGDILLDNSSTYNFTEPSGVAPTPTDLYLNTN